MAYLKTIWDEATPITALLLNKMEDGIAEAFTNASDLLNKALDKTNTGSQDMAGNIVLANNKAIGGKETGGATRWLVYVGADNKNWIGNANIATVIASNGTPTYHNGTNNYSFYHSGSANIDAPVFNATTDFIMRRYNATAYYTIANVYGGAAYIKLSGGAGLYLGKDNSFIYENSSNSKYSVYHTGNFNKTDLTGVKTINGYNFASQTWGSIPYTRADGVTIAGRYIDLFNASGSTAQMGRIEIASGNILTFWSAGEFVQTQKHFYPSGDNAQYLGTDTRRWREVWAVRGTIQTSDKRWKKNIKSVTDEDYYNMLSDVDICSYNYLDDEEKSLGIMAQDIEKYKGSETIIRYNETSDLYSISPYNFSSAILSALKHEIKLRKELSEEVKTLKLKMGEL